MTTPASAASDSPSRIVLLGAGGFLARSLRAAAAQGNFETLALGRPHCDLTQPESISRLSDQVRETDCVVFLAALTPEHGRNKETSTVNIRMFEHAAAALRRSGFAHLCYLSSDAVYGWEEETLSEESPLSPSEPYGWMHARREELALKLGEHTGRPVAVLRPAAVHGPGDTHNAYGPNRFIRDALARRQISLFGQGEEIRAHLWEGDCVRWMMEAVRSRWAGTLNITPRQSASFAQVAEMLRGLSRSPVEIVHLPRRQPVSHRSFNPSKREALWPHLPPLALEASLDLHWHASSQDLTPRRLT